MKLQSLCLRGRGFHEASEEDGLDVGGRGAADDGRERAGKNRQAQIVVSRVGGAKAAAFGIEDGGSAFGVKAETEAGIAAVELHFGFLQAPGAKERLGIAASKTLGGNGVRGFAEAHAAHAFDAANGSKRFEVEPHDGIRLAGDAERNARAGMSDAERNAAPVLEKVGSVGRLFYEFCAENTGGGAGERGA